MATEHSFQDEWIVKIAEPLGLPPDVVPGLRQDREPSLASALLRRGIVDWPRLADAVARAYSVPPLDLNATHVEKSALTLLTQPVCEKLRLLPLRLTNTTITVAMANPLDADALRETRLLAAREVEAVYALPEKIDALVAECYSDDMMVVDLIEKLDVDERLEVLDSSGAPNTTLNATGPVERFVNDLIAKAVRMEATEIRIDPGEATSDVRFLLDGRLRAILTLPKALATGPLAARVKALAGLDPAERVRGQQGRATLRLAGRELGLRVFSRGTSAGERLALRVMDERVASLSLNAMGLRPALAAKIDALLAEPRGLLLVAGPTGSGKTALLYTLLKEARGEGRVLATVENPIEFKLAGVPQIQVNESQGLHWATALRSALRGNPGAVLVGHLADAETAGVALQASTAKLLLAGVHTDRALEALARLVDMGLSPEKIAGAAVAAVSQRLLRRLCEHCRKPLPPERIGPALTAAIQGAGGPLNVYEAVGCHDCNFTGFRGRFALMELVTVAGPVREALARAASDPDLAGAAAESKNWETLAADALWHVGAGDTTPGEAAPFLADVLAAPSAPPAEKTPAPALAEKKNRRVLVTDDDAVIRTVLRRVLEKEGFVVDEAVDGIQALARVAEGAPDLVLLDLDMPEMDGFGVLKLLRRRMGMVNLPVIMLTASDDEKNQSLAMTLGADDYVLKPIKPPAIAERVNALFRRLKN
ncbi:MAG: Flp pilus assembly complex ATPase component TadA [Elusimicrobia bacterium]|nr:Flp pilus assembly complex ATPase component TadA [Elusimicrobiota bacterium]